MRDLLRSREYQVGEQYPSQRVQDQLAYLADRVVEAEHSIIPQAGRALKAALDIGPGEVILVYSGLVHLRWGIMCSRSGMVAR